MTEKLFVLDNEKYNLIGESALNLYSWLSILQSYTEEKGVTNQDVANINSLVCLMLEEIQKITSSI